MGHFAGLDLSLEETATCIVDDAGCIVREVWRRANRRHWSGSSRHAG